MSILNTITRYAADYRARRRRLRTYLTVSSLPLEIQKDIGWNELSADAEDALRVRRKRNAQ